ncbi:antibiotic biosynthesis monooxygenase family protein [Nostoc sp. MS1]|uniref:antibiotic biosynthesis monooxygenase family protein n=1 Tax=Nostoc sp. MS1 TaxID=2764711 RepID=UPI001CC5719B|nr:antibiotic biosynthesis monooxygenase [Nostoc sp. MS1]BCL39341.1 hypothetical protein NSMS1_57880 [Nostoc sp. MS1]
MFVVIYHWKIKAGQEALFQEGWHRMTEAIYRQGVSLGSRLHQAEDGTWFAYAQWPDKQAWEIDQQAPTPDAQAAQMMKDSIEERYPILKLQVVDDLLKQSQG